MDLKVAKDQDKDLQAKRNNQELKGNYEDTESSCRCLLTPQTTDLRDRNYFHNVWSVHFGSCWRSTLNWWAQNKVPYFNTIRASHNPEVANNLGTALAQPNDRLSSGIVRPWLEEQPENNQFASSTNLE